MRSRMTAVGVAVLALTLMGCSSAPEAVRETSTPAPTASTEAPSPTPVETPEAAAVPQECIDYDPGEMADVGPLADAASTADLPQGMVLNPGLQVISSVDDPGNVEVVARVCSEGVDRAVLIEAGNAIAKAIYSTPEHETVTLLVISSYVPSGEYLDRQPDLDAIQTDYEMYLWDATGRALDSNWQ